MSSASDGTRFSLKALLSGNAQKRRATHLITVGSLMGWNRSEELGQGRERRAGRSGQDWDQCRSGRDAWLCQPLDLGKAGEVERKERQ